MSSHTKVGAASERDEKQSKYPNNQAGDDSSPSLFNLCEFLSHSTGQTQLLSDKLISRHRFILIFPKDVRHVSVCANTILQGAFTA